MTPDRPTVLVVLKGYPRLSETFIAQEIRGLEQAGLNLVLVSLRQPTDTYRHAVHNEIQAPVLYLPEYLHESPLRVLRAFLVAVRKPGFFKACRNFLADFRRDLSRNRIRRFGQAAVLSAECPTGAQWLYAHFIHTPASVAAYTSTICDIPWSVSAHAKDIWTSPSWELSAKLDNASWAVTCTGVGHQYLQSLARDTSRVHLSYHGLDLDRFPRFDRTISGCHGRASDESVTILSVGRAVKKKGYDLLLQALALLPQDLHWRFVHVGDGTELNALKLQAVELNIDRRISWLGAIDQKAVLDHYRNADMFILPCRVTDDGDRDGLPNVLVEAASQGLACLSTAISAIPELFVDEENGLLVAPESPAELSNAINRLVGDPDLRFRLGSAAQAKVRSTLDFRVSINQLLTLFEQQLSVHTAPDNA